MQDVTIRIKPSPTADTRTCDWAKVTQDELLASSKQHIKDVREGLALFCMAIGEAAHKHDHDKLSDIAGFHADFRTGFKATGWWNNHRKVNRHHLNMADGVPDDVSLVDVIEHIVDCVMAGMARSGNVYPLSLSNEVLRAAFYNTVKCLIQHVVVDVNA